MKIKAKSKKLCIYLDQFAVSDMLDAKKGDLWFDIKKVLHQKYTDQKIFCPLSPEHAIETSRLSINKAKVYDDFLHNLSDELVIKPELLITSQLISSRIRKNRISLNTYTFPQANYVFNKKENYELLRKQWQVFDEAIKGSTEDINKIRKATNGQKTNAKFKKTIISYVKLQETSEFISRLEKLMKFGKMVIEGDMVGKHEFSNSWDMIIHQLINTHKFKKKEVGKLILELKNNTFDNIPSLDIRATLIGVMCAENKKEQSNDHIDIMRIATGLPIADFYLTDKQRKHELVENKLHKKYNTKVFSGKQSDLEELLIELKKV